MNKRLMLVLIIVLILGNVFFGLKYKEVLQNAKSLEAVATVSNTNEKILDFTSSFIKNVLGADKEVDFETRLALETQVRNINDKEIMAQWEKFTNSATESTAQENVKKLLEMLVTKIRK